MATFWVALLRDGPVPWERQWTGSMRASRCLCTGYQAGLVITARTQRTLYRSISTLYCWRLAEKGRERESGANEWVRARESKSKRESVHALRERRPGWACAAEQGTGGREQGSWGAGRNRTKKKGLGRWSSPSGCAISARVVPVGGYGNTPPVLGPCRPSWTSRWLEVARSPLLVQGTVVSTPKGRYCAASKPALLPVRSLGRYL